MNWLSRGVNANMLRKPSKALRSLGRGLGVGPWALSLRTPRGSEPPTAALASSSSDLGPRAERGAGPAWKAHDALSPWAAGSLSGITIGRWAALGGDARTRGEVWGTRGEVWSTRGEVWGMAATCRDTEGRGEDCGIAPA